MLSLKAKASVLSLALAGVVVTAGQSAKAALIMDQIGASPTFITGQSGYLSDSFPAAAANSTAVVDDFTVSGPSLLTKIFAAVDGYGNNFSSFSNVTGWGVEIYSSLAAASTSLVGDVYSRNFAANAAAITLTTPFGGDTSSALLNVSTAITIPAAGTYYVAVIAGNPTTNGVIGVYGTTGVAGASPGGLDAYQVNPGGGIGFTNNQKALGLDAAYAINGVTTAVPEPAMGLSLAVVAGSIVLKRRIRGSRASG